MFIRAAARLTQTQRAPLGARLFSHTAPASSALFSAHVAKIQPTVKEISISDLKAKISSEPSPAFHLLDVRETHEWNEDKLPYAVYSGRGCLERDIESLVPDPYDEIVLYCAGGKRSILAAASLQKMGYNNVASLRGGIGAWKKEGLPLGHSHKTYSDRIQEY
ncbi:hypothetical protein PhCBS80983_g03087 [Powellomyces hirtus]|uniref:Rhodanese domain-containing protein n=1 Tax=Powellomyces hirtus TaxID=109895 RepID=A0A507E369_9FUNG|nr:hypothetical protein PhCBS80983_g03087 [Powellomyces hirtus]